MDMSATDELLRRAAGQFRELPGRNGPEPGQLGLAGLTDAGNFALALGGQLRGAALHRRADRCLGGLLSSGDLVLEPGLDPGALGAGLGEEPLGLAIELG